MRIFKITYRFIRHSVHGEKEIEVETSGGKIIYIIYVIY